MNIETCVFGFFSWIGFLTVLAVLVHFDGDR